VPPPAPATPVRDANDAFRPVLQPAPGGPVDGERPQLVFRDPHPSASRPAQAPWAPWANGQPQPRPVRPPRVKRRIVPSPDGNGWTWSSD
jgi:RND superfamily putative drug exporter